MSGRKFDMFVSCFEGEATDDTNTGASDNGTSGPAPKTFTQEQVNGIISKQKKTDTDRIKSLMSELESLKTKSTLTQEERDELDLRISQMQADMMTKEELAAQERDNLVKRHKIDLEALTNDRDSWRDLYTETSIRTDIISAAAKQDAFDAEQLYLIMRNTTRLDEVKDERGKGTGKYKVMTKFATKDKDGKDIILDLMPTDAIKQMKELPQYQNLFKGEGTGGFGGTTSGGSRQQDVATLAKNPAAYRKARQEGKIFSKGS